MKLKESELKSILAEVEAEIGTLLKNQNDELAKAVDDKGEESSDGSASAPAEETPGEDSAPAEGSAPAAESSVSADASAPEASMAPDASASPDASAAPADPAASAGPADPAALQAEYSKLSPEELKAHFLAAKAALYAVMGAADAGSPPAATPAPMPPPAPAASPSPAPGPEASASAPPPAFKAEVPADMKKNPANGLTEQAAVPDAIKKSEFDALEKSDAEKGQRIKDLEAQVDGLAKAIDLALGQPVRKAVTTVAHMPKTEVEAEKPKLSKSAVDAKLTDLLKAGKLSKSEKERVVSYSMGHISYDQIEDLVKK